ncbi:ABC transporter ATP-binding protein [Bailinhaonella thermotolerans]|nr:ABC transporter ATP-binding protein [Bailinhaonella thermotolerans]
MNALEFTGLTKRFGDKLAVDGVDLRVPAGSFYGVVGPNGAGKTTTLTMGVGLLRPTSGGSRVFGVDVWERREEAMELLGVLPDSMSVPERLTGRELLRYIGRLRGLDRRVVAERSEELLDVLGLAGDERTLVVDYSTGMRKKILLATALLHGPRVLVLDEPFEAVDPVSGATIRGILNDFVAGGGSVVLSSHVMALVENLCDRVAIVHAGRVVADGTLDEVRADGSLEDRFIDLVGAERVAVRTLSWLGER